MPRPSRSSRIGSRERVSSARSHSPERRTESPKPRAYFLSGSANLQCLTRVGYTNFRRDVDGTSVDNCWLHVRKCSNEVTAQVNQELVRRSARTSTCPSRRINGRPSKRRSVGEPLARGVTYELYTAARDAEGNRKRVTRSDEIYGPPRFPLPAGRYFVTAVHSGGNAKAETMITAGGTQDVRLRIVPVTKR